MTFLYDSVIHEKPPPKPKVSKYDLSAVRSNDAQSHKDPPDMLIPEEYKIVVNHGVAPLTIEQK